MDCVGYVKSYAPTLLQRPEYVNCEFPKQFMAGLLDSKRLKAVDCPLKICKTVLENNKAAFVPFPGCSLPDRANGNKPLELASLSSICEGVAINNSGVVGDTSTSPQPSSLPPSSDVSPAYPSPISSPVNAPNRAGVIVGATAGVLVVLLIAAVLYIRSRRKHSPKNACFVHMEDGSTEQRSHKGDTTKSTFGSLGEGPTGELDLGELELYRIPVHEVRMEKTLASGAFGQVWLAEYNGQSVAVKTLLANRATKSDLQKFILEITLVAKYASTIGSVVWW
ncbi:hypothetical protein DYB32_009075 [Aphanomyces invadans]|uniref:Protein kinase domain-containing protein n=1 Tax=Aphanomyces invadans TaxID=157072 RepID=A0A3R6YSY8_9STRA|nr:hypothetical protein DYB32_009075 [Aphanomyces invadans]